LLSIGEQPAAIGVSADLMHWRTDHTRATHKPRQPPADRRSNRARYDTDLIVAAFAAA